MAGPFRASEDRIFAQLEKRGLAFVVLATADMRLKYRDGVMPGSRMNPDCIVMTAVCHIETGNVPRVASVFLS